jgi:hypothetical protein
MNDELPTMERLTTRRSDLYKSPTCILCEREEENTEHLFDCSTLIREKSQMWKEAKEKVASRIATLVRKEDGKNSIRKEKQPTKLMQLINQWETAAGSSRRNLINTCLGLFSDQDNQVWNKSAKEDGLKGTGSQEILSLLSNSLLKLFRKRIWIPRCEKIIAWEKTKGISNKEKKRKK